MSSSQLSMFLVDVVVVVVAVVVVVVVIVVVRCANCVRFRFLLQSTFAVVDCVANVSN